jgi:hypothetical protein
MIRGTLEILNLDKNRGSTFALTVLTLACGAQTEHANGSSPLTEEQLSVYRGFLDQFGALHIKNLSRTTMPLDFNGFPEGRPCLTGIELENSSETPRTTHVFGSEITKGRELNLVDPREQTKLLKQQAAQGENDLNFLILSEIAFDTKHRFAVVKYLRVCGEHCDSGATLVMEKLDGRWTTSSRRPCAMFVN